MPLPESLAPEDVIAGINAFQAGSVEHNFADSTKFDLLHQGKRFPPKAVAALATRHRTGQLPEPSEFSGGADSQCFCILRKAGFRIVPKPGLIPFDVGHQYTRKQVGDYIGTPEDTTKGDWATGYHFHTDEVVGILGWWFVFASVGIAARTGHDYPNRWLGANRFEWTGKSQSRLGQLQIDSLLGGEFPVLLFSRSEDRDPFTYHGLTSPESGSIKDQTPVLAVWNITTAPQSTSVLDDDEAAPEVSIQDYSPTSVDERERIVREIRARRGQDSFRRQLLEQFDRRCVISGCDVMSVLEAAHIRPYRGPNDNHAQTNSFRTD